MQEGYRVEPLNRDIFAELQPLMLDAFGDSVSPSYFQWKYLDNPAGEAIGCIARSEQDGSIAAFYGMIPESYRFDGMVRRIYQSCDTMTHSHHRRRGLFQSLARLTYDRAMEADSRFLALGFGGPTSTPGFLKMGWKVEFEIPYLFQPYPLTAFPSLGLRKAELAVLDRPDDPLFAMIERSGLNAANSIERSHAFVAWRLANPRRQYNYLRDGEDAYAIFYRSGDFVFLFDFWEAGDGAGRSVMSALRRRSLSPRSKGILTICQRDTPFERRLKSYGFVRNPFRRGPASDRIPFITFNSDATGPSSWSITPFDHDSY
nr:GNAT family N-acetyltransferase [Sphingomonas alba]